MKATEPCTVHGATMDDLPELMRLLRIMHSEGGMFPLDEDCSRDAFIRTLEKKEGVIGVIRGNGAEIFATIYLIIGRFWYTSHFHLEEVFSYVAPPHRKSNYADALLRFAKHSQEQLNIPAMIGILTNSRMEAKVRLYRRRLGMPSGAFFLLGATWINERAENSELWRTHTRGKKSRKIDPLDVPAFLPLTNGAGHG